MSPAVTERHDQSPHTSPGLAAAAADCANILPLLATITRARLWHKHCRQMPKAYDVDGACERCCRFKYTFRSECDNTLSKHTVGVITGLGNLLYMY